MPNNSTTHSINSQETTMSYDEKNVNEPNFNSCLPKTYQNTVCESEQTALNFTLNDIPSLTDNEKDVCITSSLQYHCDYCKKDISHAFRVKCAECIDFDLCVECFTSGVETQCHLNTHSYIPIGRNHFSLFCNDWNADEEIILLEGVSKYGFGNWTEVAELISEYNSVPKTKEQCETHYYDVHIEPFQAKQNHSLLSKWFGPTETPDMSNPEHRNILQDQMIGKYHQPVPKPLIGSLTSASCKVVGFMPLRGDFDVEYDNDAELVLSDIEFRQDETPQERELKLKVIDIYNAKLDERLLRKRIVIEKGLADWRKNQQNEKKKSKEYVELTNLFGFLLRFNLPIDPSELVQLVLNERMIRHRLHILHEWQSLGLESYDDVEKYEQTKWNTTQHSAVVHQSVRKELLSNPLPPKTVLKELNGTLEKCLPPKISQSSSEINEYTTFQNDSSHSHIVSTSKEMLLEAPAAEYPGAELLTEKEKHFCDQLQFPPIYFLLAKFTLINAMEQQEGSSTIASSESIQLDAAKTGGLYDFILHTELNTAFEEEFATKKTASLKEIVSPTTTSASANEKLNNSASLHSVPQRQRLKRRPLYLDELEEDTLSTPSLDEYSEVTCSKNKKVST